MAELSVIIPFVNEYPQVVFTIRSIAEDLAGRCDFEIIAIDNHCKTIDEMAKKDPRYSRDKGGEHVAGSTRVSPWLKYLTWTKNLSHWQAKRIGVEASTGKYLWFCDAHCVVSRNGLFDMFLYYKQHEEQLNGSIHLPVTYKILDSRRLIYKLITFMEKSEVDYRFTKFRDNPEPYEVPCMSCCGVMVSRKIYDELGGWPLELGIYGGGEHFLNFTLAVLGKSKWIWPHGTLFHFGENRGYHYLYDDYIRNKIIAAYIYGGAEFAYDFAIKTKGRPEALENIYQEVVSRCKPHRDLIRSNQKMRIEEWVKEWVEKDWIPKN